MLKSYKFRMYPNKDQKKKLEKQLDLCRWLYNKLLEEIDKEGKKERNLQ